MREKTKAVFLIVSVFLASVTPLWAADGKGKNSEVGVYLGVGTTSTSEGNYHPILFALHMAFDIIHHGRHGTFFLVFEPQVNPVFSPHRDIEGGLGLGFKYAYRFHERFAPYFMGIFGPHYITFRCADQENGFLFSSTLEAGFAIHLNENSLVHVGYRLRHLSNGGFKTPNGGLNTQFLTVGYAFTF